METYVSLLSDRIGPAVRCNRCNPKQFACHPGRKRPSMCSDYGLPSRRPARKLAGVKESDAGATRRAGHSTVWTTQPSGSDIAHLGWSWWQSEYSNIGAHEAQR